MAERTYTGGWSGVNGCWNNQEQAAPSSALWRALTYSGVFEMILTVFT
jgi:hypothetical protein